METSCEKCKKPASDMTIVEGAAVCRSCLWQLFCQLRGEVTGLRARVATTCQTLGVPDALRAEARISELLDAEKVLNAKGLGRQEFETKQRRVSDLEREAALLKRELDAAVEHHFHSGKMVKEALGPDLLDDHPGSLFEGFAASIRAIRDRAQRFDLKTLQVRLPWTVKYSRDFRANPQAHKDFAHALLHVVKAAGQLAAFVDDMDHDRDVALDSAANRERYARNLADLVICALRGANVFPGGMVDLDRAVVERLESKNGVKL